MVSDDEQVSAIDVPKLFAESKKAWEDKRRLKVISVPVESILGLFNIEAHPEIEFGFPYVKHGLPADCEALAVSYNWAYDCFDIRIRHDSFDVIPDGYMIPRDNTCVSSLIRRVGASKKEDDETAEEVTCPRCGRMHPGICFLQRID